jgi:hypothetical protein
MDCRGWLRTFAAGAVLSLAFAPAPARAGFELGVGQADEIEGEYSWLATFLWLSDDVHPWELGIGHIASRDGTALGDTPTVTFVTAAKRYRWRGFFLSTGIALTDADTDNDVLSGTFQFMNGIGWGNEYWSVSVRHLSNASTGGFNHGETYLIVGLIW